MDSQAVRELPLSSLFHQLRQAGLPLGIDEYELVLRALQSGYGLPDRAALTRLCATLWTKSLEELQLLEQHMERLFPPSVAVRLPLETHAYPGNTSEATSSRPTKQTKDAEPFQEPADPSARKETSPQKPSAESREAPQHTHVSEPTEGGVQRVSLGDSGQLVPADEVYVVSAISARVSEGSKRTLRDRFLHSDEFFPVTRRQLRQSWRFLRRPVRVGPPIEVDIAETIMRLARQGLLLTPVLVPRRLNQAHLTLLLDQEGSMTPFHLFSQRLIETAIRGGRIGRTDVFFFHNCPDEYVYRDPHFQEAVSVKQMLDQFPTKGMSVLIFSDGGAARGGYSSERASLTKAFLERLHSRTGAVVWLNPMPRARWKGTTAQALTPIVSMLALSRTALDKAIGVFHGRPPERPEQE